MDVPDRPEHLRDRDRRLGVRVLPRALRPLSGFDVDSRVSGLGQGVLDLVAEVGRVHGVVAVALGGSRASGTADAASDTDLGVYYDVERLDLDALVAIAEEYGRALARPGAWGPWVDGGAWLHVDGAPVDLILRDVARVAEQCDRAVEGRFAFHPQPGHPLGVLDVSYAGEVAVGAPLLDEGGVLAELRARVTPYPSALRRAMLAALWQVDFLLDGALKGARRADVAYVALCLSTAAMLVAHAWHAMAGSWVLNEKGVVPGVARLPVDTRGFAEAAAAVLAAPGSTPEELTASIERMRTTARPV